MPSGKTKAGTYARRESIVNLPNLDLIHIATIPIPAGKSLEVMAPAQIIVDYYAILKAPLAATFDTIRKSYIRLAKILHSDKTLDGSCSTTSFQSIVLLHSVRFSGSEDRD